MKERFKNCRQHWKSENRFFSSRGSKNGFVCNARSNKIHFMTRQNKNPFFVPIVAKNRVRHVKNIFCPPYIESQPCWYRFACGKLIFPYARQHQLYESRLARVLKYVPHLIRTIFFVRYIPKVSQVGVVLRGENCFYAH